MVRKLAAILVADVVGYSRLMGADEEATLATLKAHVSELIGPKISEHSGRIVKSTGDGVLAEFPSVVDAVRCASEIQTAMLSRNRKLPENTRLIWRMAVNLGDILVEGDDIYGDGVNVAARLETLCEPGDIVLSGSVYEHVRSKLPLPYADVGLQTLKNIAEPVRVYRVAIQRSLAVVPALPDKPSIAVLPFTNMSADTEQEFFVDGLTEDLVTELSKAPGLFVIARHSTFAFKNKSLDVRRVAEELGVRYILEGSARRAAQRIRVNAQLIDSQGGGGHLWAERFDRDLADVFAVQDEVVARIVEALVGKLAARNLPERRQPKSLEAYDLCVRGRFLYHGMGSAEGKEARQLFHRAVQIDPEYAEGHAYLAMTHWFGWVNWFDPVHPHRELALEHAQRAIFLDPNDPFAHTVRGFVLAYEHQYEESSREIATALRLDPNHAFTYGMRTDLLVMDGKPLEAIASVAQAMRLDPHPPAWCYWLKGQAEYAARQYENAVKTLRHEATYSTPSRAVLAAALAQLGRFDEARLEGRLFMADFPDWKIEEFLDTQPFRNAEDREHFADGYRKAELPE